MLDCHICLNSDYLVGAVFNTHQTRQNKIVARTSATTKGNANIEPQADDDDRDECQYREYGHRADSFVLLAQGSQFFRSEKESVIHDSSSKRLWRKSDIEDPTVTLIGGIDPMD